MGFDDPEELVPRCRGSALSDLVDEARFIWDGKGDDLRNGRARSRAQLADRRKSKDLGRHATPPCSTGNWKLVESSATRTWTSWRGVSVADCNAEVVIPPSPFFRRRSPRRRDGRMRL